MREEKEEIQTEIKELKERKRKELLCETKEEMERREQGRHYASARWDDLRMYFSDFQWNDYCFRIKDI